VWSPPKNAYPPFSLGGDTIPSFVVDGDEVHILWQDNDSRILYYSKSTSSNLGEPSKWTNFTELAQGVVSFDVKIGISGNLYVGYISTRETDANHPGVNFRRLSGTGWSQAKSLYSSQYFRTLTSEDSNIQLGVSNGNNIDDIYVVWDDRARKRIFLSKSSNDGGDWENPIQISGPEDYIGLTIPFNINISFLNDKPILIWWAGSPGVRCSFYSQSILDDVGQLSVSEKNREELPFCPQRSEFIVQNSDYPLLSLSSQDDMSFIAWNGSDWSEIQNQSELSVFENPVTLDSVLFGCKEITVFNGIIYSVGCDYGVDKDIWYRSRDLGTLDEWFPPPSAWKIPYQLTNVTQRISMLSSVKDESNNVHVFWIKSPILDTAKDGSLEYAIWRNGIWSKPGEILAGLNGKPLQYSASANIPGRLILAWVDAETGGILFSWANSDRADNPSEWDNPIFIPSNSQVNSSPEILADVSGRIIIAYAIPVNEQRGIYFVSSDDAGQTWSGPFLLFDAIAVGWDMVNHPKLGFSGDGRLHALFERFSLQGDQRQSVGLYYSQSSDGGGTWSEADLVSEGLISWSEIVTYDENIVHRLWQENNGTKLINFHQISQDGGLNWNTPISIASENDGSGSPSVDVDQTGNLHLIQPIQNNDGLIGFHEEWDGLQWNSQVPYELSVRGLNTSYSLTSSITSNGYLLTINLIGYDDLVNGRINELLGVGRSLDVSNISSTPFLVLIATPMPQPELIDNQDLMRTPTSTSPITSLYDPSASLSRGRNLTGFLFILGVLILTFVILRPKSGNKR